MKNTVFQIVSQVRPKLIITSQKPPMRTHLLFLLTISLTILPFCSPSPVASSPQKARLFDKAAARGTVNVIAGLNVEYQPEGRFSSQADIHSQQQAISKAQATLLEHFSGKNITHVKQFKTIPYLALRTDAAGLEALFNDPGIVTIEEDTPVPPTLNQSVPFINADDVHFQGFDGSGQTIAILDTGVMKTHEFLDSGKIVSEACYSTTDGSDISSLCPNGLEAQTGTGAGVNCDSAVNGCFHGTHVAGIAAGIGGITVSTGVAPGANIIAIQVFSRFDNWVDCLPGSEPCVKTYLSDQILGLERVYALRFSYNIAAVNMSLGGGSYNGFCDTDARKAIIDNLRSAGIATVIASGNDSYDGFVGAPACISSAITVGATLDSSNTVAGYSNHASMVDVMAPGSNITSSTITSNSDYHTTNGTSMAAPHVAGAIAVLKDKNSGLSVDQIELALERTGTDVTRTEITKPRIDLLEASNYIDDDFYEENDARASAYLFSEGTWLNSISGYGIQSDQDWYRIYISPNFHRVLIDLRFTHAQGNIDLALFNSSGGLVATVFSLTDNEYLDYIAPSTGGTYYILVSGSDAGNSYNLWWDDVRPPPDLIATNPLISDNTLTRNQSFTINVSVENIAEGPSAATTVNYYRSRNATISTYDSLLSSESIGALAAGEVTHLAHYTSIAAPNDGTFWVGACVTPTPEEENYDNQCSTGVQVTVASPDLQVINPGVSDTTLTPGQSYQINATVFNQGGTAAPPTTIRFYVSTDSVISTTDTLLDTNPVPAIDFGLSSYQVSSSQAATSSDLYWVGACVDEVSEESETTNQCSSGVAITVFRPDLVANITSLSSDTVPEGETYNVNGDVENTGSLPSPSTTLRYFLSLDDIITTGDTEVGTSSISSLDAGSSSATQSPGLIAPANGIYWLGCCVDQVEHETSTHNQCSQGLQLTVTPTSEKAFPWSLFLPAVINSERSEDDLYD